MTERAAAKGDRPHVSPSSLEMFFKCGEQYRRRYLEKEIIPPGFALVKGSSVDAAATENFGQKIESKEDMAHNDFVDLSAAAFDAKINAEGVLLTSDEETAGKAASIGKAKDSTARLATEWIKKVGPLYQPVGVQEKIRIVLPGPRDLLGILDLLLPDSVQDTKTAGKKKNQSDVDKDTQFTTYWALFKARMGIAPKKIIVDTVIDTKAGKTGYQQLTTERTPRDLDALANRINAFTKGVEAGVFTPAPVGSWWCAAKWCGYWNSCQYVNSERTAAAESSDE